MKKILILVTQDKSKKRQFVELIGEELGKNYQVDLGLLSDISFIFDQYSINVFLNDVPINDCDLVYIRRANEELMTWAGSLAIALNGMGIKQIDKAYSQVRAFGNKLTSTIRLANQHLPIPKTNILYSCPIFINC